MLLPSIETKEKGVLQQKARSESFSPQPDNREAKANISSVKKLFAFQSQSSSSTHSSSSSSLSSSLSVSSIPLTKEHTEEYDEGMDFKFYVPSKVSATSLYCSTELLEDQIQLFLKSDKKVMLILGDSGTGKTLSSRYFAREIKKEYTNGSHQFSDYIPVYVPLNKNAALDSHIVEKVAGERCTAEEIAELKKSNLLLFLDGYDEIQTTANFYCDNKLEQHPSIKLIITCRLEYYTDTLDNPSRNFAPINPDSGYVWEDKLDTWYVAPFTADEIEKYVLGYLAHKTPKPQWRYEDWDSYRKEHTGSMDDSEVLSNPFTLFATMEIFGDMIKKKGIPEEKEVDTKETKEVKEIQRSGGGVETKEITKLDRNEIYRRFITRWFSEQVNQLSKDIRVLLGKNEVDSLWKQAKLLAIQLFFTAEESKEAKISFEGGSELATLMESTFKLSSNEGGSQQASISTLALRCLLLHEISNNAYAFMHYSIMEYLVALKLIDEVKALAFSNELDQKGYGDLAKSSICKKLLSSSYTLIQFFTREMRKDRGYIQMKDTLFRIVSASRSIPKTVDSALVSRGAANSITLLNAAGIDFNDLDLQGIRIPGANLSGAQLDRTHLQGADMRGVNLSGSWLRQCNLSRANLTDLKLGKLPKITFSDGVNACVYSPDFRYLAVAAGNHIYLFDGLERRLLHIFKGHTDSVESVAFGPAGLLASGSSDHTVRLWDTERKKPVHTFEGSTRDVYRSVAFGPGGLLASVSWDQTVCLWDTGQKKLVHNFEGHTRLVDSVAFGPEGLLASGSRDQTVRLWDMKQKEPAHTFKGHTGRVRSVAFGPGGLLASGSWDRTVRLWDIEQKKPVHIFDGHFGIVESIAFGPGGLLASGSEDKTVCLWDTKQKKSVHTFEGHTLPVTSVAFGPEGLLVSGSLDQIVCLWDTEKKKHLHAFEGHSDFVRSVAFGPRGLLASGSGDKTVRLWDTQQKEHLHTFEGHTGLIYSVDFGPGGLLASGSSDNTVRLWDTGQKKHLFTFGGHTRPVAGVAFGSEGQLASGSWDHTVRLWDTEQKKAVHTFEGHTLSVTSVAFGPGGLLASGSWDHTVRLWNTKQKKAAHTFKGHTDVVDSVAFGPGGLLASGSRDKTVRLWDTEQKKPLHIFEGHTSYVTSIAFGPERLLASGSGDHTVRLWDIQKKKCVSIITGFLGRAISTSWLESDKGVFLSTGSDDQAIRVWKITKVAKSEFDITLFFASQPSALNLNRTVIDNAIGLADDDLELFLQHESKGTPAFAKKNVFREKKEEMVRPYHSRSCMISAANSIEMAETSVNSSATSSDSASAVQVSTTALLQIGSFGSTGSPSVAAMSSSSSVSSHTHPRAYTFMG